MRYAMLIIESLIEYKCEYSTLKEREAMYKKMYYTLFNAVTDALEAMAQQNYGQARALLIAAQQQSEEIYMDGEEDES